MKIILINPPISNVIDPSLPEILLKEEDPMPPLGLMYLAAYLQNNSEHEVKIIDCQIEKLDFTDLRDRLIHEQPDAVGITTMTFTLLDVLDVVHQVKSIDENIKVILGGPHVHLYPEETINLKGVDYLVLGEGEEILRELLDNIASSEKMSQIKGIVFKDTNNNVINTGYRELNVNLDALPMPARHLTPYKQYKSSMAKKFPVTTMFTSRGCPYKCLFCDRPHMGKYFRPRSAQNVVDEMEECQNMGIQEIFIYDDTFGVDRQRVLDICSEIIKRKLFISWDIRTRVNTVDAEILKNLKNAGCKRIHYGVEAGTQHIINILRKGITVEMANEAFRLTRKHGIQTLGYFMIGSPTETKKDILITIKLARKLNPDYAHFSITTPYPGTALYELGLENGIYANDYWRDFARNPNKNFNPKIWDEILSREELIGLLKKAYQSFYLRPTYIIKRLKEVSSFKELVNKASMGLNIFKI
ncbi:MAG: radical SAM protein [Spirochaetota bacterium]|nr:radical SAM protein [Spirochaetota bacterium]